MELLKCKKKYSKRTVRGVKKRLADKKEQNHNQ